MQFRFWSLISGPAENHSRPEDYFPPHFGRHFINPTYIYIRACWTIYMVSLHYSVHKSIIKLKNCTVMVWNLSVENPDLKIYLVIMLGSQQTSPPCLPLSEGLLISAWTKFPRFEMQLRKLLYINSNFSRKFETKDPIDKKSVLVQFLSWHQSGFKL